MYRQLGEPLKLPVERLEGSPTGREAPRYCVPPARTFRACDEVGDDAQVVIADFGEAFFATESSKRQLHTPILLSPPEFLFNEPVGRAADIWTLGCTLYNLLGERHLFEGLMPDEDHVIAEMVSTLGRLPEKWWDRWQKRGDFFLPDGSWKTDTHRAHAAWSRPLGERLGIMGREGEFDPSELVCLEKLLQCMLTYDPAQCATAKDVIASEWMQKWGPPALRKATSKRE